MTAQVVGLAAGQTNGQAGGKRVAKDAGAVPIDKDNLRKVPAHKSTQNLPRTALRI
jgi:hypothetical protein